MPLAGGIASPVVTPLKAQCHGKPATHIDSGTYVELETESPNCNIYFTTDGAKPNPWKMKMAGREITYRYKAPFTLKPGKRTVKSMAVHRVTKAESHVITKTFFVDDLLSDDNLSGVTWDSDIEDYRDENERGGVMKKQRGSQRGNQRGRRQGQFDFDESPEHMRKSREAWGTNNFVDEVGDDYLQKQQPPSEHGFAATNHSGTQINLWGGTPGMGWDVKTPWSQSFQGQYGGAQQQPVPAVTDSINQQQLNTIANQLTQRIEQSRQLTIEDVRKTIEDMEKRKPVKAIEPPPQRTADFEVNPVSKGNGDVRHQVMHVCGHLLQFTKTDPEFRAAISQPKMGKVLSADFDEGEDSYLVTIQVGKPGFSKPLSAPKKKVPPKPKPEPVKAPTKSLRPKPEDIPKGHEVEQEVRQAKGAKAPAIKLKEVEKPPEEVESAYFETEEYVQEGTLKPAPNFDANADAQKLRKAMKGLGTDEKAIIAVMGQRSFTQRQKIVQAYKSVLGRDLVSDFEGEISGNFLKICKALCLAPDEYDASELRKAMKGLGTDEDTLIEIICTRTNAQIKAFTATFKTMFNRDLEKDVVSETSSNFKYLLVSLLQASRDESQTFDRTAAKKDAQDLYDAGEKKWGTDESMFNQILLNRSNPHLRAVFEEYEKLSSNTMEEAIASEMSGDIKTGMVTFVRCIQNKPAYFARALMKSMKGLGTKDDTLLRIVITRAEIDMVQIKDAFKAEFGKTLGEWIKDDCSGDYLKILLWLVREEGLSK